jgi:glyoxylase-like metal-dependent hydrolase (beta-lactamase superfamily II)
MIARHACIVTAVLAATCFGGAANAQGGFAPAALATTKVRDNIYVIRSAASGNVTVLVGDDVVALIDAKFANEHDGVMAQLKTITNKPVKYVINTHLHADHTGGNQAMQALGAQVIASENARRIMVETAAPGLPTFAIRDYLRIYLGKLPIDLYYFGRGHTDGDIVIHLPTERVVIMGDLFALWGPYMHLVHYGAGGSIRDWSRSLERALHLDFDTVIPGHSGVTDRANMEGYLKETIRLQETVRDMNRAKKTRDEIKQVLQTEFHWSGFMFDLGLEGVITEMQ